MDNSGMSSQQKDQGNPIISFKENNQKLFKTAASALTQLFANNNHSYDEGYAQGRQDAFEEVFKWFTSQNQRSSLKNVSVYSFFTFISEKLNSTNSKMAQGKSLSFNSSNDDMQSDGKANSESAIRQLGNLHRFAADCNLSTSANSGYNSVNHLIKRVNVNLGSFNISDSRKRRRETFKFGNVDEDDELGTAEQDLPFSLRENTNTSNSRAAEFNGDDNSYVYLPKRVKGRISSHQDESKI
eukprot:CAMPEP_0168337470 /NCGR_PEP_ID=MMETSP0213-20121227/12210_1 /TAXON_ID=151035 /ORGANISM="Euplotes harpa, Strain FSP1.4" /LENGTH=240 /DNA_ID=CAMNT_0008342967 /DNA_START=16 /DNA_END=738 /DNA_ORIENTATION=+